MAAVQAGDAVAYRRLLDGIVPGLRGMARRSLPAADVEDVVQDILLTVHAVRQSYDPARPFRPWLHGIARHRIIDRQRKRGRVAAHEITLEIDHADIAGPAAQSTLDGDHLRAGLAALPQRQREAITMLKLNELSLKDAAARSGQSIAALKVATHRAMQGLRRLLGGKAGQG